MSGTPTAPEGLRTAGKRFWRANAVRDDTVDRLRLIEAAARTLDEIDTLQTALVDAPVMVAGSMGQERPNPLFGEVRQHRALLARLLAQLAKRGGSTASESARKAARARWDKVKGAGAPIAIDRFRQAAPDLRELYDL